MVFCLSRFDGNVRISSMIVSVVKTVVVSGISVVSSISVMSVSVIVMGMVKSVVENLRSSNNGG